MWLICENLRGFMVMRPPLVLFMTLLGVFAVILLTVGHIVNKSDLRNPDKRDWNDFLSGFTDVQFCMVTNNSTITSDLGDSGHIGETPIKEVLLQGETSTQTSTSPAANDIVMVSVPFWVSIQPTLDFVNIPHNVSHLSTVMKGSQLGLQGTIFLWLYWPSFNGGGADGDEQHRAFVNTYLSLCACTVVTFGLSAILDKSGKFTMVFVQNATLAGGVAVGTTANMPIQPAGAILIGSLAGVISVLGYQYLTNFLTERLRVQDTCGVHNLHGMPAVLAAVAGSVMAGISSKETWGRSLYEIFPTMVPNDIEEFKNFTLKYPDITEPGLGWGSSQQALYQILAINVTVGIALLSGFLTGFLLKCPVLDQITEADGLFEDAMFWNLPETPEEKCNNENNAKEIGMTENQETQENGKEEPNGDNDV